MAHIAISLRSLWYFRNLGGIIESMAKRGHEIDLILGKEDDGSSGSDSEITRLLNANPNIRLIQLQERKGSAASRWDKLDVALSLGLDRLHFQSPLFDAKPFLRARSVAKGQGLLLNFLDLPPFRIATMRNAGLRLMRWLSEGLPPERQLTDLWQRKRPDLFVICPLFELGRPQFSQIRAVDALGIPWALIVHSWDNLSSKSWLRRAPDLMLVWNRHQVREVEVFHGLPTDAVRVCGAAQFDEWLARTPQIDRRAFLTQLGLDPERKTILFVGSALFEPPLTEHYETEFVMPWLRAIRSSAAPELRDANIILRPHPKRAREFTKLDLSSIPRVKIWPPAAQNPVGSESRSTYYHSIVHSDAVVGLNTTAFLDAAMLKKPVFTVLDPRFKSSQEGTFHMDMLLERDQQPGVIRSSPDMESHMDALSACLQGAAPFSQQEWGVVSEFICPYSPEKTATDTVCEALEEAAALEPRQAATRPVLDVFRKFFLLAPLAAATALLARRRSGKARSSKTQRPVASRDMGPQTSGAAPPKSGVGRT